MAQTTTHLRELMDKKNLSVRKLASLAKVSPSTVQSLASGDGHKVRYSTIVAVAQAIGANPKDLGDGCIVLNDDVLFTENAISPAENQTEATDKAGSAISAISWLVELDDLRERLKVIRDKGLNNQWTKYERQAKSDAMAPLILDGDDLFVGPSENAKSNDIVLAEKEDGSEALVRLVRDGDVLWGRVDNPDWPGEKLFPIRKVLWKIIGFKRMF